jgi:GT2 family glycosyltransferase
MANDRTIFDEPHYQSLEFLAARALAEKNFALAFKLVDRRCRILPVPEPHCYVLRGEASFQMGARQAAIADLARALELAPENVAANRRMLAWAHGPRQLRAAFAIIANEHNFDLLRHAIEVLSAEGQQDFVNATIFEDTIEGWAVWTDEAPLEISISDGANRITVLFKPDPSHPLAGCGHAASFSVSRPKSENSQYIRLSVAGSILYSVQTVYRSGEPMSRVYQPQLKTRRGHRVTVIVPVYSDYQATRLCLESLLHELHSSHHHAILVNDATPDPRIAKYLDGLAHDPCIEVLTNASNLGFVGSVNRSLTQLKQGDVILLNSDTIVPPAFIDRLAAAACSSADIGTVTPLSNNGEFTSFPKPYMANPLGSGQDVLRLDKIAAKLNKGRIIDIPSGIGFCLYVTRACLDQVNLLSGDFGSGYLEDADFCLRARERGFRNVCAPSVYVGHAGSKSFGQEKGALVVRNLSILERRFPKHRAECGAFMAADPLREAREAIERAAAATASHPRLLVTGVGTVGTVTRERARELATEVQPVMILEVRIRVDGASARIFDAAGGMPQALRFNLCSPREYESLADFIRKLMPSRIELLDPANIPIALVDILLKLKTPYDIFVADTGLLGAHNVKHVAAAARSLKAQEPDIIVRHKILSKTTTEPQGQDWVDRWQKIADGAQQILVPCPQAEVFAASILSKRTREKIELCGRKLSRAKRKTRMGMPGQLGFVSVRSCAHEQSLIGETALKLSSMRPDVSITVIGTALDDMALMRRTNAFVMGMVGAEEFDNVTNALNLGCLFVGATRPLFGHPAVTAAMSSSLPTAYFDWSVGRIKPKKRDLPLNPHATLDYITDRLSRWISKP